MFDDAFLKAFEGLKEQLILTLIIMYHDCSSPFEVMYEASGAVLGSILGQRRDKILHPIYYFNKALDPALKNYIVTGKELITVVFAFKRF